jgi:hypothetical protein
MIFSAHKENAMSNVAIGFEILNLQFSLPVVSLHVIYVEFFSFFLFDHSGETLLL